MKMEKPPVWPAVPRTTGTAAGNRCCVQGDSSIDRLVRVFVLVCFAVSISVAPATATELAIEAEFVLLDDVNEANLIHAGKDFIVQNIFPSAGSVEAAHKLCAQSLRLRMADLVRVSVISEPQKEVIQLAGEVDIQRFFSRVTALMATYPQERFTQKEWQQVHQELQPLQTQFMLGLFGESSLFQKAIHSTLEGEQATAYQKYVTERKARHRRYQIRLIVALLETSIPFSHVQREKFVAVVEQKTPASEPFFQYEMYGLMYDLSKIPEADLRPLFSDLEWNVLQKNLQQFKGMGQWIEQMRKAVQDFDGENAAGIQIDF